MISSFVLMAALALPFAPADVQPLLEPHEGALVMIDCSSGQTLRFNPERCAEQVAPCSTFKIWNTALGLEHGVVTSADQPFYKWDGKKRFMEAWNQDLTLREAFAASCVPAFQELARKIGPARMNEGLRKIPYGDANTSAGEDVFWLPDPGRKTLLISPDEQAALIHRLVAGKVPFSAGTLEILKDIMTFKKTDHGTFYGKTGTGNIAGRDANLAWFVGYVESPGKSTLAFACLLKGKGLMGKDARGVVERLLSERGFL